MQSNAINETVLNQHYKEAKFEALKIVKASGLVEIPHTVEDELKSFFRKFYQQEIEKLTYENDKTAKEHLENLIANLYQDIQNEKIKDFQQLECEWKNLLEVFENSTKHWKKYQILFQSQLEIFRLLNLVEDKVLTNLVKQGQDNLSREKEIWKKEYETLRQLYEKVDEERKTEEQAARRLKNENKDMVLEIGLFHKKLSELQKECNEYKNRNDELEKEIEDLQSQLKDIQTQPKVCNLLMKVL